MFGGVGFLLNGNLLVGVWKEALIVRLGPDSYEEALLEPHVKEFNITGRAMKGWIPVEPEGVENDEQLNDWIERATTLCGRCRRRRSSHVPVAVRHRADRLDPVLHHRVAPPALYRESSPLVRGAINSVGHESPGKGCTRTGQVQAA